MGVFGLVGLDNGIVSGLEKFEAPDPAYWCAQGYAICNPDIRGVVDSDGDSVLWDRQEGRDCYDLIEWLAEQQWCSGKVGHERDLLPRGIPVVHRRRTAPAPGGDQPVGRRQRRLPRPGDAGRNARHRLRPATPGGQLLRQEPEGRHPLRSRALPADDRPLGDTRSPTSARSPSRRTSWPATRTPCTPPGHSAPGGASLRKRSGCASTTARNGRTTTTRRTWRTCAASSTTTSRIRTTGGSRTPRVRYSVLDLEGGDQVGVAADMFPPADIASTKYYLDGRSRTLTTDRPGRRGGSGVRRRLEPERGVLPYPLRAGDRHGRLPEGAPLGRGARR